ncbi:MAG: ATP-binding protein [Chloroflexota bacterium]
MNKLWIRLSLAFFGVITLTTIITFSVFFTLSWMAEETYKPDEYSDEYETITLPFAEAYIVAGKSDVEIVTLLDNQEQLQDILSDLRSEGFAPGVDLTDNSWSRILGDYLSELFEPTILQIIFIGTLIGLIASIFVSRQLARPLNRLTQASQALGQHDLSQRVNVQGSEEINALATAFNEMASQLAEAEQLRRTMLADVSHELRTPLAGLEGTLRATLDGVYTLDDQHVSNLYTQVHHLTRLVDDLHLLARAEARQLALDKMPLDLAMLLQELIEMFTVLAQEVDVVLVSDIQTVPLIEGDIVRFRQIVSNLLNNALRHTPAVGTITLTLKQIAGSPDQLDQIELSIQDTGEGIAAKHLPHLFDRFYRADPSRSRETGGTGLGLAITKALVESHGGTIMVESAGLGQGCTVRIRLPMV